MKIIKCSSKYNIHINLAHITSYLLVSVAMINKPIQYFKDSEPTFVITCTFTGNETPTGAKWTHKTQEVTNGQGDYTLNYDQTNKRSTLTKTTPTMSTDDGEYACKFEMATEKTHEPTSKSAVTVVREYTYLGVCFSDLWKVLILVICNGFLLNHAKEKVRQLKAKFLIQLL